ncbi:MAG: hypothetical protein RL264_1938 [Bacteroidota bacterium]|jgi:tetratricopeptide (TPR) repeat protein
MRNQQIDITNFEDKINKFREGLAKNYELASRKFNDAIESIVKLSINHYFRRLTSINCKKNMAKFICVTTDCAIALSKAAFPTLMNCPVCLQSLKEVSENAEISDLDENLISGLPYVIAYPLKRTLLEKHAWTKINLFKDTFQNYLKYLGLIAASEFFNSSLKDKNMVALFHQTLAQPSFGSWNQYIRETLNYLKSNEHNFFCPDLLAYYDFVEAGKKRKLYKGEIQYTDSNGDIQLYKQEATAIGMLINFRNRYLGHGLTLDEGASQKLWDEYYPIFKDLLDKLTLAIHYPMFKHEHGESYLLSSAEISPIEKGLQIPGRVWIENKEGESMDILPFFVVPGEVSIGKEDKEQILTYESYTGKTIKFFSPEGTEKQTSGKILEKLNLLLREKQKEQPISPDSFTKEVFLNRIADENKHILDTLISEKKVIPGVYVHREEMEIKLREWIGARANIFFIAAEAGSGKTNLLVEIQRQYLERNLSSLLIRACRMEKQSLKEQIAYLLNLDSSLGLKNYTSISGTQAEPTFILIDGLNEASNAEEIWQEVLELSQIFVAGSLKFVITSRANNKADIERYTLTKEGEILIYGENKERENGLAAFVYWLTPLNMVEMKTAWEDYVKKDKNKFKPLFTFDDLATFDRSLYNQISNPLVLRLFLETYHGKILPEKGNRHLNIWKDWLATFSAEEQMFMELLATEVWEKGENELMLDELLKHETLKSYFTSDVINSPYHRLKNLGWISRYVKDITMYVAFTVEGALLYLFGLKLEEKQPEMTSNSIDDILRDGTKLQKAGVESFLCEQSNKGNIDLISELIDLEDRTLTICIKPLLYFLKIHGVEDTLKKLLENPTENDWVFLQKLKDSIKENQLYVLELELNEKIVSMDSFESIDFIKIKLSSLEVLTPKIRRAFLINIKDRIKTIIKSENQKEKESFLILLIEQFLLVGDYESIIEIYNTFLKDDLSQMSFESKIKLYEIIGETFYQKPGGLNEAEKFFTLGYNLFKKDEATNFHPKKLDFMNSLGCCYCNLGIFDKSENFLIETLDEARKIYGKFHSFTIMVMANYADLIQRINRFDDSKNILFESLNVAKKIVPKNNKCFHQIYFALGWNYLCTNNLSEAIINFKNSLEITNSTKGKTTNQAAIDHQNLGLAYLRNNELELAKKHLLKAKKIWDFNKVENTHNLTAIGNVYLKEKKYDKALEFLNRSLEIDPTDTGTIRAIGDLLLFTNQFNEALEKYFEIEKTLLSRQNKKTLLSRQNSKLDLAYLYSAIEFVYRDLGQEQLCIEFLLKQIQLYTELFGESNRYQLETLSRLASYYDKSEEYQKSLELYEKILEINILDSNNSDITTSYFNLGISLKNLKRYEIAIENLKKGYSIQRAGGFLFQIAQCYQALKDYVNALDYYIQSAEIRKEDPEVGLDDEATQEAISNAIRLAKEMGREDELPEWMK